MARSGVRSERRVAKGLTCRTKDWKLACLNQFGRTCWAKVVGLVTEKTLPPCRHERYGERASSFSILRSHRSR